MIMEFDRHFVLEPDDRVYLSGTTEAIGAYFVQFPETRELPIALPAEVGRVRCRRPSVASPTQRPR